MKHSRYNIFFEHDGHKLIFNSLTSVFAVADGKFMNLYNKIDTIKESELEEDNKKRLEAMEKSGYIINDDFNELDYIEFMYQKSKYDSEYLKLTIMPTYSCNFACPYCYEGNYDNRKTNLMMTTEVEDAIAELCENYAKKGKKIRITWYGGEPLLVKNSIWSLSKKINDICDKYKTKSLAYMITNGYLIDESTVNKMKESRIEGVQICFDGPPDLHNKSRKLKNSSKGTFDTLLNNLKMLKAGGIKVAMRVHATKENETRVKELLEIFAKENLNDCLVSIAPIRNYASECSKQFDLFLDVKEFSKKELEYIVDILKLGFKATIYTLPQIIQHCVATSEHAYMIGPDGNLFGCWTDAGKPGKEIGNIFELIKKEKEKDQSIDNSYYLKNILYTPLKDKECADCNILPLCMGTCVTLKTCPTLKYNLFDVLKFEYDRRKKKVIV